MAQALGSCTWWDSGEKLLALAWPGSGAVAIWGVGQKMEALSPFLSNIAFSEE